MDVRGRDRRTDILGGGQTRPLAVLQAIDLALQSKIRFGLKAETRIEEKKVPISRGGQFLNLSFERGTAKQAAENDDRHLVH
jgi:hypothetical protein